VVKCSDISEEHTASIFRVNELVQVDAAVTQGRNVLDVQGDARELRQSQLQ